jgi:hypothetical protein
MITLEALVQELQQVPPQHLDAVHRLVQQLKAADNKRLAAETMRILNGIEELPAQAWDEIDAQQQRVRAELFTRPRPTFDDEADAA